MPYDSPGLSKGEIEILRTAVRDLERDHGVSHGAVRMVTFGRVVSGDRRPLNWGQRDWAPALLPSVRRTGSVEEAARIARVPPADVQARIASDPTFRGQCEAELGNFRERQAARVARRKRVINTNSAGAETDATDDPDPLPAAA